MSLLIATYLARLWSKQKDRSFIKSLADDYGYETVDPPAFERVYIAEVSNGDAQKGGIGGIVARWWVVDDAGLREFEADGFDFETLEDLIGNFYRCPVLKFYTDGSWVALGEKLGPRISVRRVGRLTESKNGPELQEVRTVWTQSDLEKR